MKKQQLGVVAVVASIVALYAPPAKAQGVRWSDAELAGVSSAVVTGRVLDIVSGRDPDVGYIYTYVTIELDDVIKGRLADPTIVVKQLGSKVGDLEMVVYDQAGFTVGEEVLLFLTERPRDGTLQTTGLWQGKWHIERDPETGAGVALRSPFSERPMTGLLGIGEDDDVRLLDPFRAELRQWEDVSSRGPTAAALRSRPDDEPLSASPVDTEETDDGFTLLGSGARWHEADSGAPVLIDAQASGQPGLSGGGFAEMAAATAIWNAAGASLSLATGTNNRANGFTRAQACADSNIVDNRLAVYFDDPCDEIGSGGTLAIGGFYSSSSDVRNVNGTSFRKIIKGFVIYSDGASVQSWLTTSRCFQDVQVHEIGHAIGLGHTSVSGNIMNPTLDSACLSAGLSIPATAALSGSLGSDDVAGLRFIYPSATATAPDAPSSLVTVATSSSRVDLSWNDASGDESGFKLQRRPAGGSWTAIWVKRNVSSHSDTGLSSGDYCYRIRSYNAVGSSAYVSSTPPCVTVGGGGTPPPTSGPAAPASFTASAGSAGRIDLSWADNAVDEAGFKLQRQADGGGWNGIWLRRNATSFSDTGLSSGTYCYRIRSYNADGHSNYVLSSPTCLTIGGGGSAPSGPVAPGIFTARSVSPGRVDLTWADRANDEKGFKMQRRLSGGSWTTIWIRRNSTAYSDAGLGGGTYCYRIRSYNSNGHSSYVLSTPNCVSVPGS